MTPNQTLDRILAAIRKAREADIAYWAKWGEAYMRASLDTEATSA